MHPNLLQKFKGRNI